MLCSQHPWHSCKSLHGSTALKNCWSKVRNVFRASKCMQEKHVVMVCLDGIIPGCFLGMVCMPEMNESSIHVENLHTGGKDSECLLSDRIFFLCAGDCIRRNGRHICNTLPEFKSGVSWGGGLFHLILLNVVPRNQTEVDWPDPNPK